MGDETYSPSEAARVLSRSGRSISERRIRQMLQAGELEGEQTEGGRWRIPRREVNRLLSERREREELRKEPESATGAPESVRELMSRVEALSRELGRSEARLELTEQAESTTREERDRLRAELEAEREERRRLAEQLEQARTGATGAEPRRGFWSRLFGE
jgi:excisionase family DNA binding protein